MVRGSKKKAKSVIIMKDGNKYYVMESLRKIYESMHLPFEEIKVTVFSENLSQKEIIKIDKSEVKTFTIV